MRELALFAGGGGGILGGKLLGWRPVCAVEIGRYPRQVLLRRQQAGALPRFPIWDDVRTFDGKPWAGASPWEAEPNVGRVVDGLAATVDRNARLR